jgi:hypothetical protein
MKGRAALNSVKISTFAIPAPMYRQLPIGGVVNPIPKFTVSMQPN